MDPADRWTRRTWWTWWSGWSFPGGAGGPGGALPGEPGAGGAGGGSVGRARQVTRWRGAVAGVLAALAGLAAGSVAAGLLGTSQTPVVAIGSAFIDRVPPWLKDLAISWFGTHDKTALRTGILIVLLLLAALGGVLAVRRYRAGALITVVLAGAAVAAA